MSCGLDPAELDQRLIFQRRLPGQNSVGQANGEWTTAFECWGRAQPLRGREFFAAAQMQASVDVRFRIRYRTDVDATMRVVWRGVPHDIVAPPIDVEAQKDALEIMATAGVRNGV